MKNNVLKFKSVILVSVIAVLVFNISCKKDKNQEQGPKGLLIAKNWKWSSADNNQSSNPSVPVLYHALQDCSKDDIISFSSDGKYKIARGKLHCDSKEESPYIRDYSIDFNEKLFYIDGKQYIFLELTDTQFKFAEPIAQGEARYMIYVLAH